MSDEAKAYRKFLESRPINKEMRKKATDIRREHPERVRWKGCDVCKNIQQAVIIGRHLTCMCCGN